MVISPIFDECVAWLRSRSQVWNRWLLVAPIARDGRYKVYTSSAHKDRNIHHYCGILLFYFFWRFKKSGVANQLPSLQGIPLHGAKWLKGGALKTLIPIAALHHDESCLHVELEPWAAEAVAFQPRESSSPAKRDASTGRHGTFTQQKWGYPEIGQENKEILHQPELGFRL